MQSRVIAIKQLMQRSIDTMFWTVIRKYYNDFGCFPFKAIHILLSITIEIEWNTHNKQTIGTPLAF